MPERAEPCRLLPVCSRILTSSSVVSWTFCSLFVTIQVPLTGKSIFSRTSSALSLTSILSEHTVYALDVFSASSIEFTLPENPSPCPQSSRREPLASPNSQTAVFPSTASSWKRIFGSTQSLAGSSMTSAPSMRTISAPTKSSTWKVASWLPASSTCRSMAPQGSTFPFRRRPRMIMMPA